MYRQALLGMDSSKERNSMIPTNIGTNEMVRKLNFSVNGTLLHYYHINFVVNSHVWDHGQSLVNENLTMVSIGMSTFKE